MMKAVNVQNLQKGFEDIKRRNGIAGQIMDDASIQQVDYSFQPDQLDKLDELGDKQSVLSQITRGSRVNAKQFPSLRNVASIQKINADGNIIAGGPTPGPENDYMTADANGTPVAGKLSKGNKQKFEEYNKEFNQLSGLHLAP